MQDADTHARAYPRTYASNCSCTATSNILLLFPSASVSLYPFQKKRCLRLQKRRGPRPRVHRLLQCGSCSQTEVLMRSSCRAKTYVQHSAQQHLYLENKRFLYEYTLLSLSPSLSLSPPLCSQVAGGHIYLPW